METFSIYEDIAKRSGGDIYIGVVGPVRTGKSTFVKRFMQELVLPDVADGKKSRYTDELPQSASGKTVMTTEPKFVPEEGAQLHIKDAVARIRLIDCVGFPVVGAAGFEEDGQPRLVKTPWSETPVAFPVAAEEGTQRVIRDHSTVGVVVTTDGTVAGLPRAAYEEAEEKTVSELKAIGKPFVILLNCAEPDGADSLRTALEEKYGAPVLAMNIEKASAKQFAGVLERILYEFPVVDIDVDIPDWMRVLDADSPIITELMDGIRAIAPKICKMSDAALLDTMYGNSATLLPPTSLELDAATGRVHVRVAAKEGTFYTVLGQTCGENIENDFALMNYVKQLAEARRLYERVHQAFADAKEYGYGIVPPDGCEMNLAEPRIVKRSGRVGVNLHAEAPSYHIVRVDVSGEVRPTLGNEEQSENFVRNLTEKRESEPEAAWNTNMFGRTLKEMLGEELFIKNRSMKENVQKKMRRTMTRIVNEGKGGVICILI